MKKSTLFLALASMFIMVGCSIDDTINVSPNEISEDQLATPDGIKGLLVGAQTMAGDFYCSDRSRVGSIWSWQVTAPPGGQRAQASSWSNYNLTVDGPPDDMWLYGYKAIHNCDDLIRLTPTVKLSETPAAQNVVVAIAKIIKANILGEMAAYFGSIPVELKSLTQPGYTPPAFVSQADAYSTVQTMLDEALAGLTEDADIALPHDLSFGGEAAPWAAVAHSLKARYYLHVSNYSSALSQANMGISDPTGTLLAYYSDNALEYSPWGHWVKDEGGSIRAVKLYIDLLKSEPGDNRLSEYFDTNSSGNYVGYSETGSAEEQDISMVSNIKKYGAYEDAFPVVSSQENRLIAAECKARTGDVGGAVTDVNVIRAAAGLSPFASSDADATIAEVLKQKNLQLFLEGQAYNDMRRTKTLPDPQPGRNFRFIYPSSETNANPNVPSDDDALVKPLLGY